MVSSLPKDTKNPGTYKEVNKAKPSRTGGRPSTSENIAIVADTIKIDENYVPEEKKSIPNKVVAISPKTIPSPKLTNTIQEALQNITPKDLQPELKKYANATDEELRDLFRDFVINHDRLDKELLDLKKNYDALKIKANEDIEKYTKALKNLDEKENTIAKIKLLIDSAFDEITQLYETACEPEKLVEFIISMKERINSMRKLVNPSNDETKDEVIIEEEINATSVPFDDQSNEINKKTETTPSQNSPLEKLERMSTQSCNAEVLTNLLDRQLNTLGNGITAEFFSNVSAILNKLSEDIIIMKKIKKELNKTLPLIQKQIENEKIPPSLEDHARSFEIIHPNITEADSKEKIELHRKKQAAIKSKLLDLLIGYAESHIRYMTLIQKINVSIACEKMKHEEISKIDRISRSLSSLRLDLKDILIPEIHYTVLNSLFKIIRDEVSICHENFRGYRKAYMEKNTSNIEELKKTFEKEKLEFSWIEMKWNIIAPDLIGMMSTMKKLVESGEPTCEFTESVLNRSATIRHKKVTEVKGEITAFEEEHSKQKTLTIKLNTEYLTFWRDIDLVKKELKRLIYAIEKGNGFFCTESGFKYRFCAPGEGAIDKMFPAPKLED